MVTVEFQSGTLVVEATADALLRIGTWCVRDERIGRWRAEARSYGEITTALHRAGIPYQDKARSYAALQLRESAGPPPRDYQTAAVDAWEQAGRRGVVVLPTGSGKSRVARMVLERVQRSALIVVPTLDLMEQWARQLEQAFGIPVGLLGGGEREVRDLTVSTYESAILTMEFNGNRFGCLIVDECHHLPGPMNRQLALQCIAPFRLGLTATPERSEEDDGAALNDLLGPICYRREIDELEGSFLAPYRTVRLALNLDADEEAEYRRHRDCYLGFVRRHGIALASASGWVQFLGLCSRETGGREALDAYLEQKRIARTSRAKYAMVWELIRRHAGERILVFTADNNTAYSMGTRFLLPVLTHHTRISERRAFLDGFRAGRYPVLVTSRVLNEGVDVPEASVAIVVSGTGSIREHVQRLGRILRPAAGKEATLYELISAGTSESNVSERRRQHRAYQRPHPLPR